jgi:hypothetical protein
MRKCALFLNDGAQKFLIALPKSSRSQHAPHPPPSPSLPARVLNPARRRAAGGLRRRLQQPRLQRGAAVAGVRVRALQRRHQPHGRLPLRLRRRPLRPHLRALPVRPVQCPCRTGSPCRPGGGISPGPRAATYSMISAPLSARRAGAGTPAGRGCRSDGALAQRGLMGRWAGSGVGRCGRR